RGCAERDGRRDFRRADRAASDNPWATGVQVYDNYYVESTDGGASFTAPLQVSSASSNPDASSYNNLMEQFIGDYIGIVAGPTQAYLVWTDARDASRCQAVDAYRDPGTRDPRRR